VSIRIEQKRTEQNRIVELEGTYNDHVVQMPEQQHRLYSRVVASFLSDLWKDATLFYAVWQSRLLCACNDYLDASQGTSLLDHFLCVYLWLIKMFQSFGRNTKTFSHCWSLEQDGLVIPVSVKEMCSGPQFGTKQFIHS